MTTVIEILGLHEGALIELALGEALIRGRYRRMSFFGFQSEPCLVVNESIGEARNVLKMIELGWTLRVLEEMSDSGRAE